MRATFVPRAHAASYRLLPAGAVLIFQYARERKAGLLGLGQCTDVALAQLGQQREEYLARNDSVGESGMAVVDFKRQASSPGVRACNRRDGARRPAPAVWCRACVADPRQVGALAFTLEHREIEAERVPNQDGA